MSPAILAPFGSNTSDDRSGLILLASILNIVLVLSSLPIRIYRRGKSLQFDDAVAVLAAALSIAQCIPLLIGIREGLGKSSRLGSRGNLVDLEDYTFASSELFLLALSVSKASVILFLRRLVGNGMQSFRLGCNVGLCVIIAWAVGSMIGIGVGCNTARNTLECPNYLSRWIWIAAFDAATDVGVFSFSWWLMGPLQMDWERKAAVVITFAMRLTTIGFIVAHATTIARFTKSSDRGIAIVWPLVWQITQAACAVTMSAAPSLAWIQQSFTLSPGGSSRSGVGLFGTSGSQQGSYALASIRKKGSGLRDRVPKSADNPRLRPGSGNYTAAILAGPKAPSIASGNSQADLIRCDVQYTVQHEYMVKEDELTALPS